MGELGLALVTIVALCLGGAVIAMSLYWLAEWAWTSKLPGGRGRLIAWGAPALIACVCCTAPVTSPILRDNFWLFQLERSLYGYPLPPKTRVISRESTIRPNTGNGDYCRYFVRQGVASELSELEIRDYYKDVKVQGISGYSLHVFVDFAGTLAGTEEQLFSIEINDMSERFFDIRC